MDPKVVDIGSTVGAGMRDMPRRRMTAIRTAVSSSQRPRKEMGRALSHAPASLEEAANRQAPDMSSGALSRRVSAVKNLAPKNYPFIHSSPSSLFWSDKVLQSSEGVQQGDMLGPLLFCLAIFQLQSQLQPELCLLCLDDVTL